MNTRLLTVLLVTAMACGGLAVDYCRICTNHTMCIYKEVGPACTGARPHKVEAESVKSYITRKHNRLRNYVASGKEIRGKPGPQPPATNMKMMAWDEELATVAQRWANQCTVAHDACRNVERFAVGQNIFLYSTKQQPRNTTSNREMRKLWRKAIMSWYKEVLQFDYHGVQNFKFAMETGHYTAVAWANTTRVGCGHVGYDGPEQGWYNELLVCDYGPSGNWQGASMYTPGETGSACAARDSNFTALCTQ